MHKIEGGEITPLFFEKDLVVYFFQLYLLKNQQPRV